jgi:hypothetical protein
MVILKATLILRGQKEDKRMMCSITRIRHVTFTYSCDSDSNYRKNTWKNEDPLSF